MTRPIDDRDKYIRHVFLTSRVACTDCRDAAAFKRIDASNSICMSGYVINNQLFIQLNTYKIFPTSDFYLINYFDEMPSVDDD